MKRRLFSIIILFAFSLSFAIPFAQATAPLQMTTTVLTDDTDYADISEIESDILKEVSEVYLSEYGHAPNSTPSEIDFSQSVKIYVDTDILELNTDDQREISKALETGNHVWMLYVPVDDTVFSVTVARGLTLNEERSDALTEEEKNQIQQEVEKWKVTAVGLENGTPTYQERLTSIISQNEEKFTSTSAIAIIGGIPAFRYPIALAMNNDKAEYWISLGEDYITCGLDKTQFAEEQKTGVYDFQTLSDYAKSVHEKNTESSEPMVGGSLNASKTGRGDVIAVIICAAVAILFLTKKYLRKHS